ncbi:fructose-specific phosphotransferase system IIA component [Breznakia sp. PF5-3]|uniref:PTS sugar transporter subunit IIA n=1 Tax=unclassified Breznakia TaxID=2623764 RepID=UPI0024050972|nr:MULTISPECIES: fructose PTS transporter subunit IIA [unclassified Breznakia]MDF9825421.1 fructose-specific phosphotransferase system IIA component [Breznakia sp. PM6-1]MDF9836299.1 fructose-specific phosphotransferase system IIA component [Breznakia sp. PF5-3]MDF9838723.1 fructose-specific phosphotransferase system IIA component [Breznakia sp. PFB2-8]MDF9860754.1 fructose-specific phosphotransferase system IIA component [Breznakia sp. PH5-24]
MIINEKLIDFYGKFKNKEDAIHQLITMAKIENRIKDVTIFYEAVMKREAEASTSLGYSVAIPHGRCDEVSEPFVAMAKLKEPMMWNDKEVRLIFLIGVPKSSSDNLHLKILANLSKHLIDDTFREVLLETEDVQEVLKLFSEF